MKLEMALVEKQSSGYCQNHAFLVEDEIICRGDIHYCCWCTKAIGPCTCFNGFIGSLEEIKVIKKYFSALEELFERLLDPTEKKNIVQHFLDLRDG
ncbi:MAG: hypothetical protein ACFFBD_07700 [Candidatus Hodarchaeota archaeon]